MTNRIGKFFIFIGAVLLGLYVLSDVAQAPSCNFLVSGAILLGIGLYLWMHNTGAPPQPTGRFRILKATGKKQQAPLKKK